MKNDEQIAAMHAATFGGAIRNLRNRILPRPLVIAGLAFRYRIAGLITPHPDPCETPHDTVCLRGIDIDKNIAGLIVYIWDELGIETAGCCQGEPALTAATERIDGTGAVWRAVVTVCDMDDAWRITELLNPELSAQGMSPSLITATTDMRPDPSGHAGPCFHVGFDPRLLATPHTPWRRNPAGR